MIYLFVYMGCIKHPFSPECPFKDLCLGHSIQYLFCFHPQNDMGNAHKYLGGYTHAYVCSCLFFYPKNEVREHLPTSPTHVEIHNNVRQVSEHIQTNTETVS